LRLAGQIDESGCAGRPRRRSTGRPTGACSMATIWAGRRLPDARPRGRQPPSCLCSRGPSSASAACRKAPRPRMVVFEHVHVRLCRSSPVATSPLERGNLRGRAQALPSPLQLHRSGSPLRSFARPASPGPRHSMSSLPDRREGDSDFDASASSLRSSLSSVVGARSQQKRCRSPALGCPNASRGRAPSLPEFPLHAVPLLERN